MRKLSTVIYQGICDNCQIYSKKVTYTPFIFHVTAENVFLYTTKCEEGLENSTTKNPKLISVSKGK
jgi:hypothetical protein